MVVFGAALSEAVDSPELRIADGGIGDLLVGTGVLAPGGDTITLVAEDCAAMRVPEA